MEKFNFNSKEEHFGKNDEENFSDEQVNKILEMSPKEVADLMSSFESENQLEEFLNKASKSESLVGMLSYWEKWLEKDTGKLLDKVIEEKKRIYEGGSGNLNELPLFLEKKFNEDELKLIFSNLAAVQLTFGCSKGCPFCGFDAIPGVRDHIPYSHLANLFQKYGKEIGDAMPFLYWASEPSDYKDIIDGNEWTYQDIHQLASEYAEYKPHITSRNIKDKEWLEFLGAEGTKPRLSVLEGAEKVKEIEKEIGGSKVEIMNINQREGMGLSIQNEESQRSIEVSGSDILGIGCKNGVLITPRGVYNVINLFGTNNEFPQGMIVSPIKEMSDQPIFLGDQISKHLQNCVVQGREAFHLNDNEYGFKERREVVLLNNKAGYKVLIDKKGIIQKLDLLSMKEKAKTEKERINILEEKNKIEKNIEKIFDDTVKNDNFIIEECGQFVDEIKTVEDIRRGVLAEFAKKNMRSFQKKKDTFTQFSWFGYYAGKAFVIDYYKKSGMIVIDWDLKSKEERLISLIKNRVEDDANFNEKMNKIVNDAMAGSMTHFMTYWTDEEKNKINDYVSSKDALLGLKFYKTADCSNAVLFDKEFTIEGMDKIRMVIKTDSNLENAELYLE